jgi:hypothetical protein
LRDDGFAERAGSVAKIRPKSLIAVERFVTSGVRLVIADVTIEFGHGSGWNHVQIASPIDQYASKCLRTRSIAVHDSGEESITQVMWIRPARQLERFGFVGILSMGRTGIRISAIRTDQTINHGLQRTGCLVPVDRRDDHDAVSGHPEWIDLIHPIVGLT